MVNKMVATAPGPKHKKSLPLREGLQFVSAHTKQKQHLPLRAAFVFNGMFCAVHRRKCRGAAGWRQNFFENSCKWPFVTTQFLYF
jgi:hypothetical protein